MIAASEIDRVRPADIAATIDRYHEIMTALADANEVGQARALWDEAWAILDDLRTFTDVVAGAKIDAITAPLSCERCRGMHPPYPTAAAMVAGITASA